MRGRAAGGVQWEKEGAPIVAREFRQRGRSDRHEKLSHPKPALVSWFLDIRMTLSALHKLHVCEINLGFIPDLIHVAIRMCGLFIVITRRGFKVAGVGINFGRA